FHVSIPYKPIWIVLTSLAVLNLMYQITISIVKEFSFSAEVVILHLQIIIDLICLTVLIHFSGGIENPIYLFYIFHIVISSILFSRYSPILIATWVVLLFSTLVYLEYNGIITHYTLYNSNIHNNLLAVVLILTIFIVTIYVTEYICTTFMHIYRDSKRIIDKQNKQLVDADKEKTRFFQFASHELKAPVIAIKSTLDGIIKNFPDKLDPKIIDMLKRASVRSAQLLAILKELLDLSRNRNIHSVQDNKQIDLKTVIKEIINQENTAIRQKNLDLQLECISEDVKTCGIREDFEKIFSNLINNAIRYSTDGGRIDIRTELRNNTFIFEIRDHGIGIAEEDIAKIFDEFYRSEQAKQAVNFGTGLGLSLVKQLVEKYRGKITVASEIDKGSTFTVTLPVITC
ncbi:MAG: HAMP domain-containing sensor histidine kinase, partial [Calditrichaceae bacterium]